MAKCYYSIQDKFLLSSCCCFCSAAFTGVSSSSSSRHAGLFTGRGSNASLCALQSFFHAISPSSTMPFISDFFRGSVSLYVHSELKLKFKINLHLNTNKLTQEDRGWFSHTTPRFQRRICWWTCVLSNRNGSLRIHFHISVVLVFGYG